MNSHPAELKVKPAGTVLHSASTASPGQERRPASLLSGKRPHPFLNASQVLRTGFSAGIKGLTCRGWQTLSGSYCSAWSCSAASIVESLHHHPIAVGKSAAHLVCRLAALVAYPCDPVQTIAKSRSAKR